jgi:ABC-type lipoprotein export system ATPase subunit
MIRQSIDYSLNQIEKIVFDIKQIVGIIGPTGSGKSTLLNLIQGI